VKIFVMGKNEWREEDNWPLARAKTTAYYLRLSGSANGLQGNGSLSTVAPGQEKTDELFMIRHDPVPTIGGPLCCGAPLPGNGPQDQRPAEGRSDIFDFYDSGDDAESGSDRPCDGGFVREHVGGRHRLHSETCGRVAERICAEFDGRNFAVALSRFAGKTGAGKSRASVPD